MKNSEYIEFADEFPNEQDRLRYLRARARMKELRGFYIHLLVYIAVNVLIVISNIQELKPGESYFQAKNFFTFTLWGIVVLIHAGSVFLPNFVLGKDWEDKKIKSLMKDYKSENHYK